MVPQAEPADALDDPIAGRLLALAAPNVDSRQLFVEFRDAANSGRLSGLSQSEFESVLDAVEAVAQRDRHRASMAYLRYYTAWAWWMRGRLAKARDLLEATDAAIPREPYGRQQRRELLVILLLESGDLDAASAMLELVRRSSSDDPFERANLWQLEVRLSVASGRLDRAAQALARQIQYANSIEAPIEAKWTARAQVRKSGWRLSLAAGAHQDVFEDAKACLVDTSEIGKLLQSDALVIRAVAATAIEFSSPGLQLGAKAMIEEALAIPDIDPSDRRLLNLKRLELAIHEGEDASAVRMVSQLEFRLEWRQGSAVGNESLLFEALRTRVQLRRAFDRTTLANRRGRMHRMFDFLLQDRRYADLDESGCGFLMLSTRRMFMAALVDLELQLAGHPAATGKHGGPVPAANAAKNTAERAFQVLLDAQRLSTTARALFAPRVELADLIDADGWLQPGAGILAFLPSKHVTFVFLVDRKHGVRCEQIPSRPELMVHVGPFLGELRTHPKRASKGAALGKRMWKRGRRLADRLWSPRIREALSQWTGVTVVGLDALNRLPISAVPLDDHRLVGEVLAVDLVDGVPLGVALRQRRGAVATSDGPLRLALVGVTKTDLAGTTEVRESKIEAIDFPREPALDRILATYSGRAAAWLDRDATKSTFLGANLYHADVVHVLAHGVTARDPHAKVPHGIAMADRTLWHADLRGLRLRGLFVLSTCSSGMGAERVGDGLLAANLGGALLRAGAHTVIQSSVPIELRAQLALMAEFHEALGAGLSPAAAMRRARLARRDLDGLAMRFFRGQMEVYGDGQRALR